MRASTITTPTRVLRRDNRVNPKAEGRNPKEYRNPNPAPSVMLSTTVSSPCINFCARFNPFNSFDFGCGCAALCPSVVERLYGVERFIEIFMEYLFSSVKFAHSQMDEINGEREKTRFESRLNQLVEL